MRQYDAIVVGGGPGGYACALRLAKNGRKTALIERDRLGGTCLNRGCIPIKSLLGSAAAVRTLTRGGEFGFSVDHIAVDYGKALSRSKAVVDKLVGGVEGMMRGAGVDVIYDTARFTAPGMLATPESGSFSARDIVIATGSQAVHLPQLEGLGASLLSPQDALNLDAVPKRAVIVGAGAIGMEFAYLWSVYGCKVTVVELAERILPAFDAEVSAFVCRELKKQGIEFLTGATAESAANCSGGIAVTVRTAAGIGAVEAEKMLVSAGITPLTKGIGLEKAGAGTDRRGYVPVNPHMRTGADGVYAIGDVTGLLPLAHTASAQALVAADAICGKDTEELDYGIIPRCVYCVPEAAMTGRTEEQLKAENIPYHIGKYYFNANGKAMGEGEANGFVKVLTAKDTGEILGVHMAGPHVSELIPQGTILMRYEITADEVERIVYPHPTLSEVVMEAVGMAASEPD